MVLLRLLPSTAVFYLKKKGGKEFQRRDCYWESTKIKKKRTKDNWKELPHPASCMCHPSPHLTSCYRLHTNLFLLLAAPVATSILLAWNPLAPNLFIFFLNQPTSLPPQSPQGHTDLRTFLSSQCHPSQGTRKHFSPGFIASEQSEEYRNCEAGNP